jgi:DNA-binding response OmpR family regulator
MRILVIEDELPLARDISRTLQRRGHSLSAEPADSRSFRSATARQHDLVVLDFKAAKGRSFIRQLRQVCSASRVLLLAERSDLAQPVLGCPVDADDYLVRPFAMGELVDRVEILGKLWPLSAANRRLAVGDLSMDVDARQVARAGNFLALSRREFDLLHVLMCEPGRTFSRTELGERIWRNDHRYGSRSIEMTVSRLRRKVDRGFDITFIQTIHAVGYALQPSGPT